MYTDEAQPNILKFNIFRNEPGIVQFVTTRITPDGHENCFNIGFSGDSDIDVVKNRLMLASALGIQPENFVFQTQVHGINATIVDQSNAGAGFYTKDTAIPNNDILITSTPGLCLIARSADCVPVLMYCRSKRVVAAIHSGREGCRLGAATEAARILHERFGCAYSEILVGVGPHICSRCYTVDKKCATLYSQRKLYAPDIVTLDADAQYHIDLKKTIVSDLMHIGIPLSNIEHSCLCTMHDNNLFFSARAGDMERFCAGIMITEN